MSLRAIITPLAYAALLCLLALIASHTHGAEPGRLVPPYEQSLRFVPANAIDHAVLAALKKYDIEPAALCSDEVFIRRVYLDVIGTLPSSGEVRRFLADRHPDKRAKLIDRLLERDEYNDYWAMRWCDVLRVKSEHPINLWPNGVQAYHRWVRESIASDKPYDQFARELLTSSGSNFRVAPVNFYRAVQGHEPSSLAQAVALTFMGMRTEAWPDEKQEELEAFFKHVAFKGTAEWKEEIVYLDPAPREPFTATFPDGSSVTIKPSEDPRVVFADWLIRQDNQYFTRNIANRTWAWLMGRGVIHEPDDIRADNRPSNPQLLAVLEAELVKSKFDLKHLQRLILNSRTYQQSSIPRSNHPDAEAFFAYYPVRQLDAEVIIDAIVSAFGSPDRYESAIPEPFTFVPETQRTIALADGSITSPFLELFGRPPRDSGLLSERNGEPTDGQRLHLINSSHVQQKIEKSWKMRRIIRDSKGEGMKIVEELYLSILSRRPTPAELDVIRQFAEASDQKTADNATDLAWALINTKEFLYRH